MTPQVFIDASRFAVKAHDGQRRNGVLGLPYVCHPLEVANILAANGFKDDYTLLAAAVLHDVLEDCDVRAADIGAEFGSGVVALVNEVTFINLTKAEKIRRAPDLSFKARRLKQADLISNINSITEDPTAMSQEAAFKYVNYAQDMQRIIKGYQRLDELFEATLVNFNLNYRPL